MPDEVRFIHSAMPSAPVLTGVAGALIAVLDAALVNGFGTLTADSLVISGGVATVTRAGGASRSVGDVLNVAGAVTTGGSVNGARKVTNVTGTTLTFDAAGIPDQTATGTVTYAVAPLGFSKTFAGANLAAYKSNNPQSTGVLLRVDDTGTTAARVIGYEAMTDINTGVGPFPTAAQVSGGGYWGKAAAADATVRDWVVWGDDRGFYLWARHSNSIQSTTFFGDLNSVKTPDAYAAALTYGITNYASSGSPSGDMPYMLPGEAGSSTPGACTPRSITGVGGAVGVTRAALIGPTTSPQYSGGAGGQMMGYPNLGDNGLLVCPIHAVQANVSVLYFRGSFPGIYFCPQSVGPNVFANRDEVTGVVGLPGRTLKAIVNSQGPMFTDVTGPWR